MSDWLHVSSWWTVYGILDPVSRCIMYVGITGGTVEHRIVQHRNDSSSAMYEFLRRLVAEGVEPEYCVLGMTKSEGAALHLESALITAMPQISNRTHVREGQAFWRHYSNTPWSRGDDPLSIY